MERCSVIKQQIYRHIEPKSGIVERHGRVDGAKITPVVCKHGLLN